MTPSNNSQILLKSVLVIQAVALVTYTGLTVMNEGWSLFNVFINDILAINWNGQFNLDFSCYLSLSGIWIAWRNKFSFSSIIMAIVATIIGIIVFAPYLLYLLVTEKDNMKKVLLGKQLD